MKRTHLEDPVALALHGARWIAEAGRAAIAARGRFDLALSSGAPLLYAALRAEDLPWDTVHVWQVEAAIGAPPSLDLAARVHPMPVTEEDPFGAARRYAECLPDPLDLVHLGLGEDGATAALFPGDPAVDAEDVAVAVSLPRGGSRHMTLTLRTLDRARRRLWYIPDGATRREALELLISADREIVAGRVEREDTLLLTDLAL